MTKKFETALYIETVNKNVVVKSDSSLKDIEIAAVISAVLHGGLEALAEKGIEVVELPEAKVDTKEATKVETKADVKGTTKPEKEDIG